jgi:hemolysin activation/secretion protein
MAMFMRRISAWAVASAAMGGCVGLVCNPCAVLAAVTAPSALAAPPQAAPTAKPPSDLFDLNEIRVDGDTVLPQEQVEETVYPYLGPGKTPADVEQARKALQAAYTKAGFVTVSVAPARWVDRAQGVIGMRVIERRVERLRVVGAKYFVPDAVRQGAPSVAPGKVPNINQITADLVGLNQLPDRTVQPSLKPGRAPDTVDVDLDVADKFPLHGTLEVNNRYNADTHAERLTASLSYDNFFQRGDSGTISYTVAPEDVRDAEIESASYLFHIPDSKMSLLFTYLHSNSDVIALGTTDVAGRGTTAGFRLLIPLGTTTSGGSSFTHSFSLGWDYKKFYELDQFGGQVCTDASGKTVPGSTPGVSCHFLVSNFTSAPITYYPANAAYAANWTGPKSTTDVNVSLEFGIAELGGNAAEFDNKRYDAPPGFSILRAGVTREQDLPYDLQLWGSLQGQMSNEPLVSSEQFGLGGVDSVRGYLEAETLGDYGVTLQSEFRGPDIRKWVRGPVHSWRFHLFADTGVINLRDATVGQRTTNGLSSVGVGTRVNLWGYLNGAVQDAQTLNNGPDTKAGTNRVLFRVFGEF